MSRRGISSPKSSDQRAEDSQELRLPLKDRQLGEGRAPARVPRVGLKITAGLPNASAFVSVSAEMRCLHWRPQNETQQRGFECKYLMCLLILIGAWRRKTGEDREGEDADKERVAASCRLDGRSTVLRGSVGAGGDRAPRSYPTRGGRVQGDGVLPHQSPSATARGQGFLPGRPLQAGCVPTAREAQAIPAGALAWETQAGLLEV